jgi:hypothetical protein
MTAVDKQSICIRRAPCRAHDDATAEAPTLLIAASDRFAGMTPNPRVEVGGHGRPVGCIHTIANGAGLRGELMPRSRG